MRDVTAPATPALVALLAGENRVTARWTSGAEPDLAEYRIWRAETREALDDVRRLEPLAVVPAHLDSYDDEDLPGLRTFFYRVAAVDLAGNVSSASPAAAARVVDTTPPEPPAWVAAEWVDGRGGAIVRLAWRAAEPGLTCVLQRRALGGGVWVPVSPDARRDGTAARLRLRRPDRRRGRGPRVPGAGPRRRGQPEHRLRRPAGLAPIAMRTSDFLRTPIRGDHQSRVLGVQLAEAPPAGDPAHAEPYPQSLEISFDTVLGVTEVQIAPLWEGQLRFVPEATTGAPTDPADVTPAAYPGWPVTGDLLLTTVAGTSGFEQAFKDLVPLIGRFPPSSVRYSRVRLTEDFLFTTLAEAAPEALVFGGSIVDASDPQFHAKLVVAFLAGTAGIPCAQDPVDSSRDTAFAPMPAIVLGAEDERSALRVTIASVSEKAGDPGWFTQQPAYDDIPGEPLVSPVLDTAQDARDNPAHPSHSAIPAWALFQSAAPAAYAPDHDAGLPVRVALTALRPDGLTYRRLDLARPAVKGAPAGSGPRRPYPQYRLCWRRDAADPALSLRIPMSGEVYLPLADGPHTFFALPRSIDPEGMLPDDRLTFSVMPPAPAKAIGLPAATVTVDVTGLESTTIHAHLQSYDALRAWDGYEGMAARRGPLIAQAEADWNTKVLNWYILPATRSVSASYAPVYGFIRESAGRHGLAPEFLQTVVLGEGVSRTFEQAITRGEAFDPDEWVSAFGALGLDLILYRVGGTLSDGVTPPPPPKELTEQDELTPQEAEELAEYSVNLVTAGYVDPATAAAVLWSEEFPRDEGGITRTLQLALIEGWAAGIELIAAELHARLDDMLAHLAGKTPPVDVTDEVARRYLAYIRFNTTPARARDHADHLSERLKPWSGPPPFRNRDARYNTLQRLAVTQWHEAAGLYR